MHSNQQEVSIEKIISLVDKQTATHIQSTIPPRLIARNSSAVININSKRAICIELFRQYRELGRFTLRRGDETVAVGIVTELFQ